MLVGVDVREESVDVFEDDGWEELSEKEILGSLVFHRSPISAIESKREVWTTSMGMKGRAIIGLGLGIEIVSVLAVGHGWLERMKLRGWEEGTSDARSLEGTASEGKGEWISVGKRR